ncbi:MAG: polysaccharide biosynthesis protein [Firmicutes bacterium]|nr:polysaccharide biosynthesis protein [Bacillota bacterium]
MSFIHGALALAVAGLVSKMIGALYRVPLSYLLGAEGIGLYQMAYPFFNMAFVLLVSGIPTAAAKLSAEEVARGRYSAARRIFRVTFGLLVVIGSTLSLSFYFLAPFFAARLLGDPRALYPLRAMAPAVFSVSILVSLRSHFQGLQRMKAIAVSQVIEQLFRVATMLGLAFVLLPLGLEYAAAGATFGAVSGALAGVAVLGTLYLRSPQPNDTGRPQTKGRVQILRDIIRFALPITCGAFILPVMETVDAAIVPLRLQAVGFTVRQATALYGQLTGMAVSLIAFPTVITGAFAYSLMPAIAEAASLKKRELISRRVREALRLTVLVGLPATVGLYLLPGEICALLFGTPEAGIPLSYLAYGSFFLSLQQTTAAILQGLGQARIPLQSVLLGACCNAGLNYYLTVIPILNIRGAALGTGIGFTVAALFNLRAVHRLIDIRPGIKDIILRPLLATLGMAITVKMVHIWFISYAGGDGLAVIGAVLAGGAVYLFLLLVTGALPFRYFAFVLSLRPWRRP